MRLNSLYHSTDECCGHPNCEEQCICETDFCAICDTNHDCVCDAMYDAYKERDLF